MPYDDPNNNTPGGDEPPTEVVDPAGSGTATDPYNVAAALEKIKVLDASTEIGPMYVKGTICSLHKNHDSGVEGFGNGTFYISDNGVDDKNSRLLAFQVYYLGNVKFTSADQVKVGDEVVIYGKFVNYAGNTPETTGKGTSYIYSLNGQTNGGEVTPPVTGEAKGDGTLENPFNSVAANTLGESLENNAKTENVYIKGKVVSIKEQFGTQYGNATFYISDDGQSTNQFYVYRCLYLGNKKYEKGQLLKEGDEVVVCGKITKFYNDAHPEYGTTVETVQGDAYVVSINGSSEIVDDGGNTGGDDNPGGETGDNDATIDPNAFGLANQTALTTHTTADGNFTLTFDKNDGATDPAYYTGGGGAFRMYPKNSVKIVSKNKVASLKITVDIYNGITCNAEKNVTSTSGNVTFNEDVVNITGINSSEFTVTNAHTGKGTASQFRIKSIAVTYVK